MHDKESPLAGQTIKVNFIGETAQGPIDVTEILVEDWADRVFQASWKDKCLENIACYNYAIRVAGSFFQDNEPIPDDDDVLYGKFESLGFLVHATREVVSDGVPE